jgi:Copine
MSLKNKKKNSIVFIDFYIFYFSVGPRFQINVQMHKKRTFWEQIFWGSKFNLILSIDRLDPDGKISCVHRSTCLRTYDKSAEFKETFSLVRLLGQTSNNENIGVRFTVYDRNLNENHIIARANASMIDVLNSAPLNFKQTTPKKRGEISRIEYTVAREMSFVDRIRAGLNVLLTVSIDFTYSNIDGNMVNIPLHNQSQKTDYLEAIEAIGNVIFKYSECGVALYGFGARLGPNKPVSHCFSFAHDSTDPFVFDLQSIEDAYRNTLSSIILAGPTNFACVTMFFYTFCGTCS